MWDTTTVLNMDRYTEREIGVFLDIFPIDGYPEDERVAEKYITGLQKKRRRINYRMARYFKTNDPLFIKKCFTKLLMRRNPNYYARRYNAYVKRYPYEGSAYVGVTTTTVHIRKERNPK